jgi:hypothetical protein
MIVGTKLKNIADFEGRKHVALAAVFPLHGSYSSHVNW